MPPDKEQPHIVFVVWSFLLNFVIFNPQPVSIERSLSSGPMPQRSPFSTLTTIRIRLRSYMPSRSCFGQQILVALMNGGASLVVPLKNVGQLLKPNPGQHGCTMAIHWHLHDGSLNIAA
ncbi:uncharacterized protein PgNI_04735 [Pyricularia grisea]|uniref:Plastocyanin-like domain-containing protein n=1 Tax=Pyricularia grisea TaxID=148305 RepID=A0A6P8BCA5_PYRGI|nr:uncharacterized protein PgNI_04735 [Pyricularia grisea]TLD13455.1 hypothetical protein PgNI_04735 [Pyricularia grisea]